jgi:hypothetical protein
MEIRFVDWSISGKYCYVNDMLKPVRLSCRQAQLNHAIYPIATDLLISQLSAARLQKKNLITNDNCLLAIN